MNLKLIVLLFLSWFSLSACARETVVTRAPGADESMTLERTVCYGFCPAYKVTVRKSGVLIFEGRKFVSEAGENFVKELPEGTFSKLIDIAEKHDFASFDPKYPSESGDNCGPIASDSPTTTLSFQTERLTHAVEWYQGCFEFDGRDRLTAMLEEIDAVLALDDWIGPRDQFYGGEK